MSPAERRRFENCLALISRGATAGERSAALAAAERIAASAGLTLAEARAGVRAASGGSSGPDPSRPLRPDPPRAYAWAKPKEPVKPVTVEELLRQKADTEAWRKRRGAAADRKRAEERAEQSAYEQRQREVQAERDRDWAAAAKPVP